MHKRGRGEFEQARFRRAHTPPLHSGDGARSHDGAHGRRGPGCARARRTRPRSRAVRRMFQGSSSYITVRDVETMRARYISPPKSMTIMPCMTGRPRRPLWFHCKSATTHPHREPFPDFRLANMRLLHGGPCNTKLTNAGLDIRNRDHVHLVRVEVPHPNVARAVIEERDPAVVARDVGRMVNASNVVGTRLQHPPYRLTADRLEFTTRGTGPTMG